MLIASLASLVGGDCEKPDWEVGDEWKYDMTVLGMTGTVTYKVSDVTSINVNGTNYDVYDMEIKGSGGIQHTYYLNNNLALVKTEAPSTGTGSGMTWTYDPPKEEFDFPLVVGKTWNSTYTQSISGGGLDPLNVTLIENYTVVKIESVTVKAGTFECYRIESHDENEITNTTRWYSKEVKNVVKSSVKISELTTEMELISFTFDGKGEGSDPPALPNLLLFIIITLIILGIVIGLAVRRKGKKAKETRAKNLISESTPTGTQPSHPASKTTPSQPSSTKIRPPTQ